MISLHGNPASRLRAALACLALAALPGCGSSSPAPGASQSASPSRPRLPVPHRTLASPALRVAARFSLPAGRLGAAAAAIGSADAVIGGLDAAGSSTASVYLVHGPGAVSSAPPLPGAVHDAAATAVDGRLLLFGGGPSEGSDQIIAALPEHPRLIGHLPLALSDLGAVTIGHSALVAGGWDGSSTNARVFDVSAAGHVAVLGRIPVGVRYPAVGALGRRLVVAGGELSDGTPTARVWAFDPATGRVSSLPDLPAPIDHGAGVTLGGWFYEIGGLRRGVLSDEVLALGPGARHWVLAGRLPSAVTKPAAAPLAGGIAVYGGQDASGTTASATLLKPAR